MVHEISDTQRHSPRVTRKRQARMHRILCEAFALARDEGRDALTLGRLADRLDYTPGALYRYFPSKDALVAELQRSVIAWLAQAARDRVAVAAAELAGETPDPASRALLPIVVTGLTFEHAARTAPVELGLLSMYLSPPEFGLPDREAGEVFAAAWQTLGDLAGLFSAAAEAGALAPGDARERAVALWAALQGVVQTRKLARSAGGRIDPTRIAHGVLGALLAGWGAAPDVAGALLQRVVERGLSEPGGTVLDLLEDAA